MSYNIVPSSPQASETPVAKPSYPFADLEVGQSFLVPIADVTEANLRMTVSRQNTKKPKDKHFTVVKHGEPHNVFEVARLA